ncbi:MAG TPA: hypothetical protein VFH43_01145 [Candidatus Kapabacteria bacterium]|nr:hypothetical protein [Candidatus Kapabacteria bacterium]
MALLGSITLAIVLLTLAYFAFLERTYLRDQAQEIGDVSIIRWRKAFTAIVGILSATGLSLLAWTIGQM